MRRRSRRYHIDIMDYASEDSGRRAEEIRELGGPILRHLRTSCSEEDEEEDTGKTVRVIDETEGRAIFSTIRDKKKIDKKEQEGNIGDLLTLERHGRTIQFCMDSGAARMVVPLRECGKREIVQRTDVGRNF